MTDNKQCNCMNDGKTDSAWWEIEYNGWKLERSFRRQMVFAKDGEQTFCAIDYNGVKGENIRDENGVTWTERLVQEVRQTIDSYLAGELSESDCAYHDGMARTIRHNMNYNIDIIKKSKIRPDVMAQTQ